MRTSCCSSGVLVSKAPFACLNELPNLSANPLDRAFAHVHRAPVHQSLALPPTTRCCRLIQLGGSSSSAIETHWHDHVLLRAPQGLVTAPASWWQTCQVRSGSIFSRSLGAVRSPRAMPCQVDQYDAQPLAAINTKSLIRLRHFNDNLPSVVVDGTIFGRMVTLEWRISWIHKLSGRFQFPSMLHISSILQSSTLSELVSVCLTKPVHVHRLGTTLLGHTIVHWYDMVAIYKFRKHFP